MLFNLIKSVFKATFRLELSGLVNTILTWDIFRWVRSVFYIWHWHSLKWHNTKNNKITFFLII